MVAVRLEPLVFGSTVTVTDPSCTPLDADNLAHPSEDVAVQVVSVVMVSITAPPVSAMLSVELGVTISEGVGTGGAGAAQGAGARFSVVVAQSEPPIMARHAVAMIQGVIFFIICYCLDVIRAF